MRSRGPSSADPSVPRALSMGAPLPPQPLLFGSGSPSAPTSIWSTTTLDSAALSANNLRATGYPGAQTAISPPTLQTYGLGLGQGAAAPPATPTRNGYSHQRQLSQSQAFQPASPPHQGPWGSQGSSHLASSHSLSQPRHTLSPSSAPFAPQQSMSTTRSLQDVPSPPYAPRHHQQQQASLSFSGPQQQQFSLQQLSTFPPSRIPNRISPPMTSDLPSHNTWSYSGAGSLNSMGAPLGPFAVDLPYTQSHLQQQPQMHRPGAWAPS